METFEKLVLHRTILFQSIDEAGFDKLIGCLSPRIRHYAKNEIIILTGASVDHIGVILSGTASAYTEDAGGNRTIMSSLSPSSVFGEILVSTRAHKSPVTVYCTSDVKAAFIDYQRIYSMCSEACTTHRTFLQNIHTAIGDRYFDLFERFNILREKSLRSRIQAYLFALSGRGSARVVTIPFSKTMLAEYLLANRSAVSRELRRMEDEGIIAVSGRKIHIRSQEH